MPIQMTLEDLAWQVITTHEAIEAARRSALDAASNAERAEEESDEPPPVKEAYRVIADLAQGKVPQAEAEYRAACERFRTARNEWAASHR